MGLAYGIGGLITTPPKVLSGVGVPASSFKGMLGQSYFDLSDPSSPVEYVYNGITWNTAGANPATTTTYGTVLLTDNNEPVATKFYADNLAIAGSPDASTVTKGISYLATNADVVSPYATPLGANTVLTPANITSIFAAPPPSGSTTPSAGVFTTLEATGLFTGDAGATINTAGTALNLASDADTAAVNIGTGAAGRTITMGNVTSTTGLALNSGTGGIALASTSTGDITLNSSDTLLLDSAGVLELNSSAGVISVGNDAVSQNINIGTAGTRAISIGNSTATTSVSLNGGTGSSINIGTNAVAHTVSIGNVTLGTAVAIDSGTGPINIGTSIAKVITIGNITGATQVAINSGTAGIALVSTSTGDITAASGDTLLLDAVGVLELNSSAGVISVGNDAVSQNINVGTAGTRAIAIGNSTSTTSVSLNGGTGSSVNIGTNAIAHTVTIGNITTTTAVTVNTGTGGFNVNTTSTGDIVLASADTVLIDGAGVVEINSSAGVIGIGNDAVAQNINIGTGAAARTITIGNVTSTTGLVLNSGTGGIALVSTSTGDITAASGDTLLLDSVGVLELNSSGGAISIGNDAVAQAVNIGTGASARTISIGTGVGGNTVHIADGAGINTITIGNGASANTVTLGSTNTTSTTTINSGSGNVNVTGGHLAIASVAKTLLVNGGAVTDFIGTGVLTAGTQTIANTNIATGDVILITRTGVAASTTLGMFTYTISNATSFTVTSVIVGTPGSTQTGDVSTYAYFIIRPT